MRRNGCIGATGLSLNVFQAATVVLFGGLLVGFFSLFVPLVKDTTFKLVGIIVYSFVAALVVVLDLACTWTDPSDYNLLRKTSFVKAGSFWNDTRDSQVQGEVFYCVLCEVSVGGGSKHCKACDKCVRGFDHHCKWLNNCVGASNYRTFFALLCLTLLLLVGQLGVVLVLFILSFTQEDFMRDRLQEVFSGSLDRDSFVGVSAMYLGVLALTSALIGELLVFHIILIRKNMSTYDYILAERQRREESAVAEGSDENSNMLAIADKKEPIARRLQLACSCNKGKVFTEEAGESRRKRIAVYINPCRLLKTEKPKQPQASSQGNGSLDRMEGGEFSGLEGPCSTEDLGASHHQTAPSESQVATTASNPQGGGGGGGVKSELLGTRSGPTMESVQLPLPHNSSGAAHAAPPHPPTQAKLVEEDKWDAKKPARSKPPAGPVGGGGGGLVGWGSEDPLVKRLSTTSIELKSDPGGVGGFTLLDQSPSSVKLALQTKIGQDGNDTASEDGDEDGPTPSLRMRTPPKRGLPPLPKDV